MGEACDNVARKLGENGSSQVYRRVFSIAHFHLVHTREALATLSSMFSSFKYCMATVMILIDGFPCHIGILCHWPSTSIRQDAQVQRFQDASTTAGARVDLSHR